MENNTDIEAATPAQTTSDKAVDMPRIVRPLWLTGTTDNDWTEDAGQENGNYFNSCVPCGMNFIGHKRRYVCRKCYYAAKAAYDAMTPEEREKVNNFTNGQMEEFYRTNDQVEARRDKTPPQQ